MRSVRHERGFALLIVLWTLVLLSLLVSVMAAAGSGRVRQAADLRRNAALEAGADGGVQQALFHLLDGSRAHWLADGAVHRVRSGDQVLSLRIESLAGRVNPNRASIDLLAALLQAVGADSRAAQAIGAQIISWRVPNTQAGADYRAAGREDLPPGQPFESIPEIGLVLGMTPALLATLTPHLSLYRDSDPDPATADPVVRQALQRLEPNGTPAPAAAGPPDPGVVAVTATAEDRAGRRFVRHAVALTGSDAGQALFRIVEWN